MESIGGTWTSRACKMIALFNIYTVVWATILDVLEVQLWVFLGHWHSC